MLIAECLLQFLSFNYRRRWKRFVRNPREKRWESKFHPSKTRKRAGAKSLRLRHKLCVRVLRGLEGCDLLSHSCFPRFSHAGHKFCLTAVANTYVFRRPSNCLISTKNSEFRFVCLLRDAYFSELVGNKLLNLSVDRMLWHCVCSLMCAVRRTYSIVRKKKSSRKIPGQFQKWACAARFHFCDFSGFFSNFPDFFPYNTVH